MGNPSVPDDGFRWNRIMNETCAIRANITSNKLTTCVPQKERALSGTDFAAIADLLSELHLKAQTASETSLVKPQDLWQIDLGRLRLKLELFHCDLFISTWLAAAQKVQLRAPSLMTALLGSAIPY